MKIDKQYDMYAGSSGSPAIVSLPYIPSVGSAANPDLEVIRALTNLIAENNLADKVRDAADIKLLEYIAKL